MDTDYIDDSDSKDELPDQEDCFCLDTETLNHVEEPDIEEDKSYEVLSTEEIVKEMIEIIKEVNTIVEIPPTITRILLNYFKWDKEKLYERYYDGDQESLFKAAHIVNPLIHVKENFTSSPKRKLELCEICCQEYPSDLMTSLACRHRYCTDCWTTYLTRKIIDQGDVQTISCSAPKCDILVDDQTIMNIIRDQKVKSRYQYLITNNFISCNRYLCHCTFPGCNNIIKVQFINAAGVTCTCGNSFCFQCGGNCHEPVSCDILSKWQRKCSDDSATYNWIAANTKECPKCKVRIEKNGGCNHMLCKNVSCHYEFCWICMKAWATHSTSWNKCDTFIEDKKSLDNRSALKRFLFYFDRYKNHLQSLKFENKLHDFAQDKMDALQDITWVELKFLKKAVDVLCQCRHTLTYTYVLSYYLKRSGESSIFEDNQRDLHSATEQLSQYLEHDINRENIKALKPNVQDKYKYCASRRKVLLEHLIEGFEKKSLEYEDP